MVKINLLEKISNFTFTQKVISFLIFCIIDFFLVHYNLRQIIFPLPEPAILMELFFIFLSMTLGCLFVILITGLLLLAHIVFSKELPSYIFYATLFIGFMIIVFMPFFMDTIMVSTAGRKFFLGLHTFLRLLINK